MSKFGFSKDIYPEDKVIFCIIIFGKGIGMVKRAAPKSNVGDEFNG